MQNPDRCNGRGFLFCRAYQQYRAHRNCTGAPAAGTSSYRRDPYPVVVLYLQEARNLYRTPGRFRTEVIKQDRDVAADTAAGAKLCTKIRTRKRNEMPDFPIGNYAFFGVGEPAACGAGVVTVPFAVVACCNAFPRPQRDDAERGRAQHSQTQIRRSRAMYAPGCGIVL